MSQATLNFVDVRAEPTPCPADAACAACGADIRQMLAAEQLQVRFRPIADLTTCGIFGHLASLHSPTERLLQAGERLIEAAKTVGLIKPLTEQFYRQAIQRFHETQGAGVLLLPVSLQALSAHVEVSASILRAARAVDWPLDRLIVVFPGLWPGESGLVDWAVSQAATLASAGVALAANSLGCAYTEQQLWARQRPQFLLVDDAPPGELDFGLLRHSAYARHLAAEAARGRRIIVGGIGSLSALRALKHIEVTLACGDFIGRPYLEPTGTLSAAAHKAITEGMGLAVTPKGSGNRLLERMMTPIPPVSPQTPSEQVFLQFERNRELRALAVVEDGVPIGLISRYDMVDNMARPYRHELYGRKPCTRFMDPEPLIVEVSLTLQEISEAVVHAHPRHLISGFIVTDEGHYLGIGSVQDLVREVTTMQMEAARYANPLTQLPGNVPISQTIDNLISEGQSFVICYCDLDNFKPFNDVYGFARGDEVIRLTAQVLSEVCDPDRDFLGHIGGDDFVMIMKSEDWQQRCERALALFGEEILGFFSADDIERGGYVTENRKGRMEFHSLTSLSIGIVEVQPGMFANHLAVASVAAEVKKKAKAIKGNSLFVNRRSYGEMMTRNGPVAA